jgi:hypothetical protein
MEAITVCVNYGDFLAHTLPHNRKHFSNYIVVTSTSDSFTKRVCDFYEVKCFQTDIFYQNNDVFNKGKGINAAIKHLNLDRWVLHLDADIYLFPNFKTILKGANLDEQSLYSVDRLMCNSYEDWLKFLSNPLTTYNGVTEKFKIGTRLINQDDMGYLPLGYFQLWHPQRSGVHKYCENHGKADYTDLKFSKQWSRDKRKLIADMFVVHLDSQKSPMGENWSGRKTPLFGKSIFDINVPHKKEKNSYEK